MAENAFAPVTPGEILKDEFLTEYWAIAEPAARTMGIQKIRLSKWRPRLTPAARRTELRRSPSLN